MTPKTVKKNAKKKRIFKKLVIGFFTIVLLLSTIIGIALHFIFTPEKITPIVVDILNEQLKAEVACESVELTFFSTFPRVGIQLHNTSIKTLNTGTEKDTLARFKEATIVLNTYQYLKNDNIDIKRITVSSPKIYAYLASDGTSNWNILEEDNEKNTSTSDSLHINDITVQKLNITNATLIHDDATTHLKHKVNDFEARLNAKKTSQSIALGIITHSKNIEAYYKGNAFHSFKSPGLDIDVNIDRSTKIASITSKDITVNNIHFKANGTLKPNKEQCALDIDFQTSLATSSMTNFLEVIPQQILPKKNIVADGAVLFNMNIKGLYGSGFQPNITANLSIKDGHIAYQDFPGKINHLDALIKAQYKQDLAYDTWVHVDSLYVNGTGIDITANGQANNIFDNPKINAQLDGDLDLSELYEKFPVDSTILLKGKASTHVKGTFSLADIQESNFKNIILKGNAELDHLVFQSKKDSIQFDSEKTKINFDRATDETFANITVDNTNFVYKNDQELHTKTASIKATAKEVKSNLTSRKGKKRRAHHFIDVQANLQNVKGNSKTDSLQFMLLSTSLDASIHPRQKDQNTYITSTFSIDSLGVKYLKNFIGISKGGYTLTLEKKGRKKWIPKGNVHFNSLYTKVDNISTPITIPETSVSFENDNIHLEKALIGFGHSKAYITGNIEHTQGFFNGTKVSASLDVKSRYINTNELMETFIGHDIDKQTTYVQNNKVTDTITSTSAEKQTFTIPDSLSFNFTTHIKKLKFGTSYLTDLEGNLQLHEGTLKLNHFRLKTEAANLNTTLVYKPESKKSSTLDFRFDISDIEMSKLTNVLPVLDSLMPATNAFVGKAEFRIKGTATLDSHLDFQTSSIKGIAALRAKDIMVLDGPTFKELAKTFKFKSKEMNPVKRLEVEMKIDKNTLDILPALLEIDRYKLAIGGEQHLDMSYDYHISVLKSPVPFKMGVNVDGEDFDHYKIKLTKAKYKYYFTDKERLKAKADSTIINTKQNILTQLGFTQSFVDIDDDE